ncbi:TrbI/VirB10 family protein (plasmid) [Veillonella rogosae]|uniref:TrbI/VirB10 family protein n=1 Tax=Veillonella rogosae TaxID=423477 RepID=A0AA46X4S5_9FIRM|nr:TrbI/VirB10 family protein [Veillonella rogosae]UZG51999.1 TrbI/VirB10 family protein [Veillonella rogosae]
MYKQLKRAAVAAFVATAIIAPSIVPFTVANAASARYIQSDTVLQAGSVIPATLLTQVTSDNLNADVVAIVRQNVYDSVTGNNILIPAGTKLIGHPEGYSGTRINLSFYRMILPDGNSISLPDQSAVTGTGFAGVKDKHSGHSWQKFKGALSGALLSGALIGVTSKNTDKSGDRSYGQEAMTGAATDLIQNITSSTKNREEIKSTTTIRIGYQFNILLNADVAIQPWEE